MTVTVNTTWYTNFGNGTSTGYYAVTKWTAGATNTAGAIIRQNSAPSAGNERCFVCIVAGTSANPTEPTWTLTKGAKTTDNTTTWQECSGLPALNADLTNTPLSSANRSGAQVLGNLITNNAQTFYFICTTAGTTGSGEPSYVTTAGSTTTDSGCTWTCLGAVSGFTTKWGAPQARILNSMASTWAAAGDTIYISSVHAETTTSPTYTSGSATTPAITKLICVGNTGNIPPQGSDVTTGASITGSAGFGSLILTGAQFWDGVSVTMGGLDCSLQIGYVSNDYIQLQNCALVMTGTSNSFIDFGTTTSVHSTKVIASNTTIALNGGTANGISFQCGNLFWKDTPSALSQTSGWPVTLFTNNAGYGSAWIENVDLSAFAGTQYFGNGSGSFRYVLNKCKLSSATLCNSSAIANILGFTLDVIDCDSGGNTYRHERWAYEGNHVVSTTAVFTGGATNGTTAYSWAVSPSSVASWIQPFECLPMAIWNTTTGANRTVTLQGIYNGAALPNNDEIWLEVSYFGTASSTLGTRVSETKATILTTHTALTANTSAVWNGSATARANSHAYSLGNLISVSTAATGQLYICTTAGTSAGSIPGGYASCADGSTVTDGGAVFLAMMRFYMQVVCTSPQPQSAGYLNCYVRAAKASAQYWVDPNPTLS